MKQIIQQICFVLFFGILSQAAIAQMNVTPVNAPYSPESLIEDVLLGKGVELVNVSVIGENAQIGTFSGGQSTIGIENGIMIATGNVFETENNVSVEMSDAITSLPQSPEDPDLSRLKSVATNGVFDPVIYEIQLIPSSDELVFEYVFASEEYPEFSCTDYSDFFGIFVSGPGINDTFSNNATNIALIPGTNERISINTVHPGYTDTTGALPSCAPNTRGIYNEGIATNFVFDGFLNTLTASINVTPCQTYTLKIAIADQGDGQRDSGVFLKAKSLSSETFPVRAITPSRDGVLVEGCDNGSFLIELQEPSATPTTINLEVLTGTDRAVNGTDFTTIPNSITIPAGDTTFTIDVIPTVDNTAESMEEVAISVQTAACSFDTVRLFIRDPFLETPDLGLDTSICPGGSALIDGTISTSNTLVDTGSFNGTLSIPSNGTEAIASFNMVSDIQYLGPEVIESVCINLNHSTTENLNIYLQAPNGDILPLSLENDINATGPICFTPTSTDTISTSFDPSNPAGPYYPEGSFNDLYANPSAIAGTWNLLIYNVGTASNPLFNGLGNLLSFEVVVANGYSYTYNWSPTTNLTTAEPDSSIVTVSPTTATDYTLTINDTYGCSTVDTKAIAITDSLPAPNTFCGTSSETSVTFIWNTVADATGYEINIENSSFITPNVNDTTHTITGLTAGQMVNAEIRAIGACGARVASQSCTALDCAGFNLTQVNATDATCSGGNDGTATVSYDSPHTPIVYTYGTETNGTGIFSNFAAGVYTIRATDALGCSTTIDVNIGEAAPITTTMAKLIDISCTAPTGTAEVTPANGVTPYSFSWSNGATTADASGLTLGWHYVTVTDANSCTAVDSIEFTNFSTLSADFANDTVCFGELGELEVQNIFNATAPLSYAWSGGVTSTSASASGLAGGTYTVTITDATGCEAIVTAEVFVNSEITGTTSTTPDDCTPTPQGTATVVASGGLGTLTYLWNDAAGQTTPTASNLSTGTYSVTITDSLNCTFVTTAEVLNPAGVSISDFRLYPETCEGSNDGRAALSITGGTAPFTYNWNDPSGSTTDSIGGLSPGNYRVVVTDANNCTATQEITIDPGNVVVANLTPQDITCNGAADGIITSAPTGGTTPYSFTWSSGGTNNTVNNLVAGEQYVTVTDALGCEVLDTATINEPLAIISSIDNDTVCFGETGGVLYPENVQNGTSPYTYAWSNGETTDTVRNLAPGTYTLTISDANNCQINYTADVVENGAMSTSISTRPDDCSIANTGLARVVTSGGTMPYTYVWSDPNAQVRDSAVNLTAGSYSVTVTDHVGCSVVATANVGSPPAFSIDSIASTDVRCNGENSGQANVEINGGTAPFEYFWNNPSNSQSASVSNLAPGMYKVTVQDANRCSDVDSVIITEPDAITLTDTVTNINCFGDATGALDIEATGGTDPLSFVWEDNSTDLDRVDLIAGVYSITATDGNNCQATQSYTLTEPQAITQTFTTVENDCWNQSEGSVEVAIAGGVQPYQINWGTGSTTNTIEGLDGGMYPITVTDANNCESIDSALLIQPDSINVVMEIDSATCFNSTDGEIRLELTGGTGNLRTALDVNAFGELTTFSNLARGYYNIAIRDDNGCIYDTLSYIDAPDPILIDIGEDTTISLGDSILQQSVVENAQIPWLYAWSSLDSGSLSCTTCATPMASPMENTMVTLTVTDSRGCIASDSRNIYVDLIYQVDAPNVIYPDLALRNSNQFFTLYGKEGVRVDYLEIYDRWGNKVFRNDDFQINNSYAGWDGYHNGERLNPAVFVWVAKVTFPNGHTETFKGDLTLVR